MKIVRSEERSRAMARGQGYRMSCAFIVRKIASSPWCSKKGVGTCNGVMSNSSRCGPRTTEGLSKMKPVTSQPSTGECPGFSDTIDPRWRDSRAALAHHLNERRRSDKECAPLHSRVRVSDGEACRCRIQSQFRALSFCTAPVPAAHSYNSPVDTSSYLAQLMRHSTIDLDFFWVGVGQ